MIGGRASGGSRRGVDHWGGIILGENLCPLCDSITLCDAGHCVIPIGFRTNSAASYALLERPGLARQETTRPEEMKRPHMDAFLTAVYEHYDLCVWSQTSWRWLELKLTELGFLTNSNYR